MVHKLMSPFYLTFFALILGLLLKFIDNSVNPFALVLFALFISLLYQFVNYSAQARKKFLNDKEMVSVWLDLEITPKEETFLIQELESYRKRNQNSDSAYTITPSRDSKE